MNDEQKFQLPLFGSLNIDSVNKLYEFSQKSLIAAIVFVSLTAGVLYSKLGLSVLMWALSLLILSFYRLYLRHLFKTKAEMYTLKHWYIQFIIFSFMTGFLFSVPGFYFLQSLDDYYQIFIVVVLLGFSVGASISLSSEYKIAIPYISIILLPLVVNFAMQKNHLHLIIAIMLIVYYLAQIFLIFKNYTQETQIKNLEKIQKLVHTNETLLQENKQFIADMVHQIKTPLTTIILNTSLMEMKSDNQNLDNIKQINSAITMLSNAFEDLSYLISNDTMHYTPIQINLSAFLRSRVDFFKDIIEHNHKKIHLDIADDITLYINDTELERLIDNNITNAIKHSQEYGNITIGLGRSSAQITLKFSSEGDAIQNTSKIFEKNYTESNHAKRSLGLGLYMVKSICDKNDISYHVESKNGFNTFSYIFKI